MKLIGYCRVSSKTQRENTSLEGQLADLNRYCEQNGHELVQVFTEVGSGKDLVNRPQFVEAMAAVESADGLIVGKLDRFGRHCRGFLAIVEDFFIPSGRKLILLDLLGVDVATPEGKFQATLFSSFSELERAKILERINQGISLAMCKDVTFGSPKYGEKPQDKGRVSVDSELKVIEFIRRQYRLGLSLNGIAQKLNDRGIPTKRGKKWTAQGVKNILGRFQHYSKKDKPASIAS